ncbi:MAG: Flp pilus assembly protein CpaB [Geobacter sp.]|nr:Flp pilus assembly protein CpaB [Geobacter sp.]
MSRHRALIIVTLVALVFAGLATWGIVTFMQRESLKAKGAGQAERIVVAAADLPIGTKLDASQLKLVGWPKDSIPQGSFTDPNAIAGRIIIRQISAGDVITEPKLIPKEGAQAAGLMTYIVPKGHRAVTVAVNEVAGVAGFLAPHNRVDVVVTTTPTGAPEPLSKIVLQDVTILATGQITEQKEGKPVVVPTVTLDLVPDDAEKLVLASSKGTLQLLLRNIVDTETVDAKGATIGKVLGVRPVSSAPARVSRKGKRQAPVAKAPTKPAGPPPYSVEMIKGTTKSTREFVPEEGQ